MNNDKTLSETLKTLLDFRNNGLTKGDFQAAFSTVVTIIENLGARLIAQFNALEKILTAKVDAKLATVKNGKDGKDGRDGRDGRDGVDGLDGAPGQDANEEALMQRLTALIPPAQVGEDYRNALEALPDGEKLAITAIEGLLQRLDQLAQVRGTGGGVTNMRIQQAFKYILKTEAPVGAINGSNTAYTVSQPIFAVLSFSLNGETIAQLPNYTIKNKTITFSSALPAAYSGKDFEIKYI